MRFSTRVDRHTCLFHFVSNLAEWHFACVPAFNEAWLKETGPLDQRERKALDVFAAVAREFPYGDRWIGRSFVLAASPEEALEQAKGLAGVEKGRALEESLEVFTPRFDAIWGKDEPRLKAFVEHLAEGLMPEKVERAVSMVETFLQAPWPEVEVHLLLSRGGWVLGGANEGPGHITLAAMEQSDIGAVVEVVLHEVIHLLEHATFTPMYRACMQARGLNWHDDASDSAPGHLMREALMGALLPGGCLSPILGHERHNFERRADEQARRGLAARAALGRLTGAYVPLVEAYVTSGKAADERLFGKAYDIFAGRPWFD